VITDEYTQREQADTVEVLKWTAVQDWCSGQLGMWGISWGGFSALQTAMLRPPELKAIVAAHATHDRFACDVHYTGGSVHAAEQGDWVASMVALNGLPPDPDIVGDRWLQMWMDRLDQTPQWPFEWLRHQRRDEYWLRGSPCADYRSISVPTLLLGGWLDGYVDGMLALLEHLESPKRAVIGPWGHYRPATGVPRPTYDHLDLMARWFGHHLRGDDNGVMDMPLLTAWIRTSPPYDGAISEGFWRAEGDWPAVGGYQLASSLAAMNPDRLVWEGPLWVGQHAPFWDRGGLGSTDPTADDDASLLFETEPLSEPIEILGVPAVELMVSTDQNVGMVAVRLLAVSPEGQAYLICRGNRNLVFPNDLSDPVPIKAGVMAKVLVPMLASSVMLAAGWRLRLAVAGADFPVVWPPAQRCRLQIDPDRSRLLLPLVPLRSPDTILVIPEAPAPLAAPVVDQGSDDGWQVGRVDGTTTFRKHISRSELQPDRGDLVYRSEHSWEVSVADLDPATTTVGSRVETALERPGWAVGTRATLDLTADDQAFSLAIELTAIHDGTSVWHHRWQEDLPREYA
jgi:predicted acyl esterase